MSALKDTIPGTPEYWQDAQERACARTFLDHLSSRDGTIYEFQRAEEKFPGLVGSLRWDFVATQKGCDPWIAIEIKRLPFLDLNRQWHDWKELLEHVDQATQTRLGSSVLVYDPPRLNLGQQKRKELVSVLANVIAEEASGLTPADGLRDISPVIAQRFSDWPESKSNNNEYKSYGEFRPGPIHISVESAPTSGVRLFGVGNSGDLIEDHRKALAQVINEQKDVHANSQLGLAKEKGAQSTVLLLDCDAGSQEDYIREFLIKFPTHLLSEVDHIYTVGGEKVTEVF